MTRRLNPTVIDRNELDVAWCAGFFDGEGHVSCKRGYPNTKTGRVTPQLYANVPQAADNIEVLQFFQSVIGFGEIGGPYPTKKKPKCVIHYGVHEVEPLFVILKPYLKGVKTADFQRALMTYMTFDPKPTAEDFGRTIKRQKKKGCPKCKVEWNGMVCVKCGHGL